MQRITTTQLTEFLDESNRIEGIHTPADSASRLAARTLLAVNEHNFNISAVSFYVDSIGGGSLRNLPGMNVEVGGSPCPPGGPQVAADLRDLLKLSGEMDPTKWHIRYERLHPFMDGNGRSGRVLWLRDHLRAGTYKGEGFLRQWCQDTGWRKLKGFEALRQRYYATLSFRTGEVVAP